MSISNECQFNKLCPVGDVHLSFDAKKSPLTQMPSTHNFNISSIKIGADRSVTVNGTSYQTVSICTGAGTCIAFFSTEGTCITQTYWSSMTLYNSSGTSVSNVQVPASCTLYATYGKAGDGVSIFGCRFLIEANPY